MLVYHMSGVHDVSADSTVLVHGRAILGVLIYDDDRDVNASSCSLRVME